MFGDISGMMNKIKETQQKVEETKKRLDSVLIDEVGAGGKLKITITANRELKSINIDKALFEDAEELEDYLLLTINKAINRATTINETELAAVAKNGMPSIPGMDLFK